MVYWRREDALHWFALIFLCPLSSKAVNEQIHCVVSIRLVRQVLQTSVQVAHYRKQTQHFSVMKNQTVVNRHKYGLTDDANGFFFLCVFTGSSQICSWAQNTAVKTDQQGREEGRAFVPEHGKKLLFLVWTQRASLDFPKSQTIYNSETKWNAEWENVNIDPNPELCANFLGRGGKELANKH